MLFSIYTSKQKQTRQSRANKTRVEYLIHCFFTDNQSVAERKELDQWLAASPDNLSRFEELVRRSLQDPSLSFLPRPRTFFLPGSFETGMLKVLGVAAVLAAVYGIAKWDALWQRDKPQNHTAGTGNSESVRKYLDTTYRAPAHAALLVILPDSSRVELAAGGTITTRVQYQSLRQISLTGDAQLQVSDRHKKRLYIKVKDYELLLSPGTASVKAALAGDSIQLEAGTATLQFTVGKDSWHLAPGRKALYEQGRWTPLNY